MPAAAGLVGIAIGCQRNAGDPVRGHKIGLFRRGTLLRRFTRCGRPSCRCQADPPQLLGPYWQWTCNANGETVTVTLSQAALLQGWLENGRVYDQQLAELEQLSVRVTDRLLAAAAAIIPP
jgi:hypothetical protein